jgi:hypothetical protein
MYAVMCDHCGRDIEETVDGYEHCEPEHDRDCGGPVPPVPMTADEGWGFERSLWAATAPPVRDTLTGMAGR